MSKRTEKMVEELKNKLIDKGIDVSEFGEYFKEIEDKMKDEKYGLVWEDNREPLEDVLDSHEVTLKEDESLYIKGGMWSPNHRIIEGDNLASMTSLKERGEKFEFIYGDPPYNSMTFKTYKDSYNVKGSEYKGSGWLSFMSKRLRLAHDLLTDDGVIFLSIDDRQLYELKLLMDEIFGKENFVCDFKWRKRVAPAFQTSNGLGKMHESVLCYGKNYDKVKFKRDRIKDEDAERLYPLDDGNGKGRYYLEKINSGYAMVGGRKYLEVTSPHGHTYKFKSVFSEETFKEKDESGEIVWYDDPNRLPKRKFYLRGHGGVPQTDVLDGKKYGFNQTGTMEVGHILGSTSKFSYPKPVNLIKSLIEMMEFEKDIQVLDIFSGSGTTGHAVLEVNSKSKYTREFTLLNISEEEDGGINICKDVTYERMKRVMSGYKTGNGIKKKKRMSQLKYYNLEFNKK